MKETCFNCGAEMKDGICPDCGYSYPFMFQCPYYKENKCIVNKRTCKNKDSFQLCEIWHKVNSNYS